MGGFVVVFLFGLWVFKNIYFLNKILPPVTETLNKLNLCFPENVNRFFKVRDSSHTEELKIVWKMFLLTSGGQNVLQNQALDSKQEKNCLSTVVLQGVSKRTIA